MSGRRCHHRSVTDRILSKRALNRALLARQLLLERSEISIPEAVDQVGGLQTQYAPSGYVGLWTRLRDFRRGTLTQALEDRSVVQATLMRSTIHLVSREDFWPLAGAVRSAQRRRAWRTPVANRQYSSRDTRWIVTRISVAWTTLRSSSAWVRVPRRKSRSRVHNPT